MTAKVVRRRDLICDVRVLFLLGLCAFIACAGVVLICVSIRCPDSFGVRIENGTMVCGDSYDYSSRSEITSYGAHDVTHSNGRDASMVTAVAKTIAIILILCIMLCIVLIAAFKVAQRKKIELENRKTTQFIANIQSAFDSPIYKGDKAMLLAPEKTVV